MFNSIDEGITMKKIMTVLITIASFALIAPLAHATAGYQYGPKYIQMSESKTERGNSQKADQITYRYGKKHFRVAPADAMQSQGKVSYRYGVKYNKVA